MILMMKTTIGGCLLKTITASNNNSSNKNKNRYHIQRLLSKMVLAHPVVQNLD